MYSTSHWPADLTKASVPAASRMICNSISAHQYVALSFLVFNLGRFCPKCWWASGNPCVCLHGNEGVIDRYMVSACFTFSSCPTSSFFFSPYFDYSDAVLLYLCVSTPRCTCPNGGGSALYMHACVYRKQLHTQNLTRLWMNFRPEQADKWKQNKQLIFRAE